MIKKVFIVFTVAFLLQLFLISCCRDTFYQYYSITDVQTVNTYLQTDLPDSATIKQEDYRLKIHLSQAPYLRASLPSLLINQALALTCEEIFVGLDSKIESFVITADQDIFNTRAGDPLDYRKFRVDPIGFDSTDSEITIKEWLENLNTSAYIYNLTGYLRLKEPLLIDEYITFKINILLEDGTAFESQTAAVKLNP